MAARKQKHRKLSPADWENSPEEEILQIRIRDMGLKIEGSPLEPAIAQLHRELSERGIDFRPSCYLADEWFCPDKVPIIGVPFCLSHQRLKSIEHKLMLEVEGGTAAWCMQLLRHECGHAINYAYRLYNKTRWRDLFGQFSSTYSDSYSYQPYSRRYVRHLKDSYAQAHPDDDFAETFAVWLTPDIDWEKKYNGWPALKKIRYIDHLMKQIGGKLPVVDAGETPYSASRMTSTLEAYYERRRNYMGDEFPGYYDDSLRSIFPGSSADTPVKASKFVRMHRRHISSSVAGWTSQRKYDVDQLIRKLIGRCDALGLTAGKPESVTIIEVTAFVAAVANKMQGLRGQYASK